MPSIFNDRPRIVIRRIAKESRTQFQQASALVILAFASTTGSFWLPGAVAEDKPAAPAASSEPDGELLKMVLDLLGEKDKDLRALGFDQVRTEVKGPAATREIAARLSQLPDETQVGLLKALADRGDAAARPAVLEVLTTSEVEPVRVAAIEALGAFGNVDDLPRIVDSLKSIVDGERNAAQRSLVRLTGDDVSTAIVEQLKSVKYPLSRKLLIEVLAERRALDAVPQILAFGSDKDQAVRATAIKALGELATLQDLSGLMQLVLKAAPGDEREALEKCVMRVCDRAGEATDRAKPLLAVMESLSPDERLILLPTLGRVGGATALPAIEAALADQDALRHEAGIRALCNWPDASVAPRLIELVQDTAQPAAQRALALSALIRVAPLPDKRPDAERLELVKQVMSMCTRDEDRQQLIRRARAIRSIETLRFLVPYLGQPAFAPLACESIVELAHHRGLREPNKQEFHRALDQVLATSKDAVVIERAGRYKKDQTWVRPQ
jgi:HEAT repeat protein